MMQLGRVALAIFTAVMLSTPAFSQANAQLQGTFALVGDSCAGIPEGATAMTADPNQSRSQIILVCNGSVWEGERPSFSNQEDCEEGMQITFNVHTGGLRCGPPQCNENPIGTTCVDGTIYAGLSPDGDVPMFTTPADAPTLMSWNDGSDFWLDTDMENCTSMSPS